MKSGHRITCACVLTVVLGIGATAACAQPTVTSVSPAAAAPSDEITILGSFPVSVTHVRFTATVGGFVGIANMIVVPNSVSSTRVKVTVPQFNSFAPPNAVPPGLPQGTLDVRDAGGLFSSPQNFYFMEGSAGAVTTTGLGSTATNQCRAASSFTLAGGAPASPNAGFTATLENAMPSATTFLAIGSPAMPPSIPVGDGLIALDLAQPFFLLGPFTTDTNGRLTTPLAIPAGLSGLTTVVAYSYIDPLANTVEISNGLVANF